MRNGLQVGATRASRTEQASNNDMRCFNQLSQSAVYKEDEIRVSVTVCGGSYGGGSEVLVIESNQEHATISDTEICTTLPASMGLGGGYVPMILDTFANSTGSIYVQSEIASCLRVKEPYGGGEVLIITTSHNSMHMNAMTDISASLAATDHKDPPVIVRGGVTL